jgi:hypothetical protein
MGVDVPELFFDLSLPFAIGIFVLRAALLLEVRWFAGHYRPSWRRSMGITATQIAFAFGVMYAAILLKPLACGRAIGVVQKGGAAASLLGLVAFLWAGDELSPGHTFRLVQLYVAVSLIPGTLILAVYALKT